MTHQNMYGKAKVKLGEKFYSMYLEEIQINYLNLHLS